jgi:hypothetical protein
MCYLLVRPEIGSDCHSLELWDRGAEEGRGADGRLNKAHCTGFLSTCCWGKAVRLSFKLSSCPAWVDRLGGSSRQKCFRRPPSQPARLTECDPSILHVITDSHQSRGDGRRTCMFHEREEATRKRVCCRLERGRGSEPRTAWRQQGHGTPRATPQLFCRCQLLPS